MLLKGATRWVFLIGRIAIKIPALYSYRTFLNGLLSNLYEGEYYKAMKKYTDKLCPVIFRMPGGLMNIMPRAELLDRSIDLEKFCTEEGFSIPAEYKESSFGILNGKVVVVDYH